MFSESKTAAWHWDHHDQWLFVMDNKHVFYKFSMELDDDFKSLTYGKEILKLQQTNDELSTLVWK